MNAYIGRVTGFVVLVLGIAGCQNHSDAASGQVSSLAVSPNAKCVVAHMQFGGALITDLKKTVSAKYSRGDVVAIPKSITATGVTGGSSTATFVETVLGFTSY